MCDPSNGACSNPLACKLIGTGSVPAALVDGLDVRPLTLANGMPHNQIGGFGSAIAYTGVGNLYLTAPDRGPADGTVPFVDRYYQIELTVENGVVSTFFRGGATLNKAPGVPFIGLATSLDSRFDPEGLRVSPHGTLFVSDEYGPFLNEFDATGNLLRSFSVPAKFLVSKQGTEDAELPPGNSSGRQPNRGMEGLAITPDGSRLYGIMQSPHQDGALNGSNKRIGTNSRILEVDAGTGATREFLYQLDDKGFGLNEMLAVNDYQFLVIERDGDGGSSAKFKRLVLVDLAGATDISGIESLPSTGTPSGVTPVSKTPFLDLLAPAYGLAGASFPEKIEGIAFGPDLADGSHLLLVTHDNDFVAELAQPDLRVLDCAAGPPGVQGPERLVLGRVRVARAGHARDDRALPPRRHVQPRNGCVCSAGASRGHHRGQPDARRLPEEPVQRRRVAGLHQRRRRRPGGRRQPVHRRGCWPAYRRIRPGRPRDRCAPRRAAVSATGRELRRMRCRGPIARAPTPSARDARASPGLATRCSRPPESRRRCRRSATALSNQCDGAGNVVSVTDDNDIPADTNACTFDLCTAGVPSNPALPAGTTCGSSQVCDGAGSCIGCITSQDCPGSDTECGVRTCNAGVCGVTFAPVNTFVSTQIEGDCVANVCDGVGNVVVVNDDRDVKRDGNACTNDVCTAGVSSFPNAPVGTPCEQTGGTECDGAGVCVVTFMAVRMGSPGGTNLSSAASPVFVDQIDLSGRLLRAIALPTVTSGAQRRFVNSGQAGSEGSLALSLDGRYVTLGGYDAAPGTTGIASTASATVPRVVARIDAAGTVDTSTSINDSVHRKATSAARSPATASSSGRPARAAACSSSTSVNRRARRSASNLANVRTLQIINGQLFGSAASGNFNNVFTVGAGVPNSCGRMSSPSLGFAATGPSPYAFVFIGQSLLYVADDSGPWRPEAASRSGCSTAPRGPW